MSKNRAKAVKPPTFEDLLRESVQVLPKDARRPAYLPPEGEPDRILTGEEIAERRRKNPRPWWGVTLMEGATATLRTEQDHDNPRPGGEDEGNAFHFPERICHLEAAQILACYLLDKQDAQAMVARYSQWQLSPVYRDLFCDPEDLQRRLQSEVSDVFDEAEYAEAKGQRLQAGRSVRRRGRPSKYEAGILSDRQKAVQALEQAKDRSPLGIVWARKAEFDEALANPASELWPATWHPRSDQERDVDASRKLVQDLHRMVFGVRVPTQFTRSGTLLSDVEVPDVGQLNRRRTWVRCNDIILYWEGSSEGTRSTKPRWYRFYVSSLALAFEQAGLKEEKRKWMTDIAQAYAFIPPSKMHSAREHLMEPSIADRRQDKARGDREKLPSPVDVTREMYSVVEFSASLYWPRMLPMTRKEHFFHRSGVWGAPIEIGQARDEKIRIPRGAVRKTFAGEIDGRKARMAFLERLLQHLPPERSSLGNLLILPHWDFPTRGHFIEVVSRSSGRPILALTQIVKAEDWVSEEEKEARDAKRAEELIVEKGQEGIEILAKEAFGDEWANSPKAKEAFAEQEAFIQKPENQYTSIEGYHAWRRMSDESLTLDERLEAIDTLKRELSVAPQYRVILKDIDPKDAPKALVEELDRRRRSLVLEHSKKTEKARKARLRKARRELKKQGVPPEQIAFRLSEISAPQALFATEPPEVQGRVGINTENRLGPDGVNRLGALSPRDQYLQHLLEEKDREQARLDQLGPELVEWEDALELGRRNRRALGYPDLPEEELIRQLGLGPRPQAMSRTPDSARDSAQDSDSESVQTPEDAESEDADPWAAWETISAEAGAEATGIDWDNLVIAQSIKGKKRGAKKLTPQAPAQWPQLPQLPQLGPSEESCLVGSSESILDRIAEVSNSVEPADTLPIKELGTVLSNRKQAILSALLPLPFGHALFSFSGAKVGKESRVILSPLVTALAPDRQSTAAIRYVRSKRIWPATQWAAGTKRTRGKRTFKEISFKIKRFLHPEKKQLIYRHDRMALVLFAPVDRTDRTDRSDQEEPLQESDLREVTLAQAIPLKESKAPRIEWRTACRIRRVLETGIYLENPKECWFRRIEAGTNDTPTLRKKLARWMKRPSHQDMEVPPELGIFYSFDFYAALEDGPSNPFKTQSKKKRLRDTLFHQQFIDMLRWYGEFELAERLERDRREDQGYQFECVLEPLMPKTVRQENGLEWYDTEDHERGWMLVVYHGRYPLFALSALHSPWEDPWRVGNPDMKGLRELYELANSTATEEKEDDTSQARGPAGL